MTHPEMDYFDFNMHLPFDQLGATPRDGDSTENAASAAGEQARTPIGTPAEHPRAQSNQTISVSTAFHPDVHIDNIYPDIMLVSSDQVFFHVHLHRLLSASDNGFNALLPPPPDGSGLVPIVVLPEPAEILNIALHAIYNVPASQYAPSFETLSGTLDMLMRYGIPPARMVLPPTPLYALLLSHAPLRPIDTYALAAAHSLEDLAVAVSAHLLSFSLPTLTDELAARIGAHYLKRLFLLHHNRLTALKQLLLQPPAAHVDTPACGGSEQRRLTRAWALAAAHLVWDARPNLSMNMLQAALRPLERDLTCATPVSPG